MEKDLWMGIGRNVEGGRRVHMRQRDEDEMWNMGEEYEE